MVSAAGKTWLLVVALVGCSTPLAPRTADAGADAAASDAGARPDAAGDAPAPGDDAAVLDVPLGVAARDVAITPVGSARVPDVAFDARDDAYVVVYTWVPGPEFRTEARVVTIGADGTPSASPPLTVDELASPSHNSAEATIAVPDAASSAPALAVWSDDRLSGGSGQLEIYGQFLDLAPSGATRHGDPFRVSNVDVTNESLPDVVWMGSGFYVAWADDRERGVRDADARVVYGRTVSTTGALGPELRLGDDTLFQTYPQLERCGDRVLAAWTDYLAPGGPLVIQYRARLLDAASGDPIGGIFVIAGDAMVSPDPPALACDPRDGSWRVAWTGTGPPSTKQVRLARVAHDGVVSAETTITGETAGGGSPRLAWIAPTHGLVLSWHAQDSMFGWARELAGDGAPRGAVEPLTPSEPTLGTFWTAVAAHDTRAEALVAATLDYDRVSVTVLR